MIIGPRGVEKVVNSLRVIAPELPFPIRFYELKEKEHRIEMDGYAIEAFQVRHNVICYGYSITIPRAGKFDPEKAKENQIPMKYWNRLQKGETLEDETGRILTSDMILGAPRKGIRLTGKCYLSNASGHPELFRILDGRMLDCCIVICTA